MRKRAYFDDCYSDDQTSAIVLTEHKARKEDIKTYNDEYPTDKLTDARLYLSDVPIVAYGIEWSQIIALTYDYDSDLGTFQQMEVHLTHNGMNFVEVGPLFLEKKVRSRQWRSNVRHLLNGFGIDCAFAEGGK